MRFGPHQGPTRAITRSELQTDSAPVRYSRAQAWSTHAGRFGGDAQEVRRVVALAASRCVAVPESCIRPAKALHKSVRAPLALPPLRRRDLIGDADHRCWSIHLRTATTCAAVCCTLAISAWPHRRTASLTQTLTLSHSDSPCWLAPPSSS